MSQFIDFDSLEENVQMLYLTQAYEQLYEDGKIPYGVSTGDDQIWSDYEPVINLAIDMYNTFIEEQNEG